MNPVRKAEALILKAKAKLLLAQAQEMEGEPTIDDLDLKNAQCVAIGVDLNGDVEVTVYKPSEQSITIARAELPMVIDSLIQREALIRRNR